MIATYSLTWLLLSCLEAVEWKRGCFFILPQIYKNKIAAMMYYNNSPEKFIAGATHTRLMSSLDFQKPIAS